MKRFACHLTAGLTLALGLTALSSLLRADDDEDKKKAVKAAAEAVNKFTDAMPKLSPADLKKEAEALARKHEMEAVMHQFKPRVRGGLGIGPKANDIKPDSIELKLFDMAKKPMSKAAIDKEAKELIRSIEVTAAIAEVAHFYKPKDKKPGRDPADWTKLMNEMQAGSKELIAALKTKAPKAIYDASVRLNSSCVECHAIFRDNK
jgi:hypothetical protein